MAAGEQRDQQFLDDLVLADDDAGQLLLDVVEGVAELADRFEVAFGKGGGGSRLLSHGKISRGCQGNKKTVQSPRTAVRG